MSNFMMYTFVPDEPDIASGTLNISPPFLHSLCNRKHDMINYGCEIKKKYRIYIHPVQLLEENDGSHVIN
jgi:hypothetical protein